MTKNRIIIAVAVFAALLITAVSFLTLRSTPIDSTRLDKAGLIYKKAEEFLAAGEYDRATSALAAIIERYPDSEYMENSLREMAAIYFNKDDYIKAKDYYDRLLKVFPSVEDAGEIRDTLKELNEKAMRSPAMIEGSLEYEVQPGDTLFGLAKKFGTTVGLIKRMNGLQSDMIRSGQKLKINTSKFSILVDKSRNILVLKKDGEPFKTYAIATGKDNATPAGVFTIVDKMIRPPWTKPGVGVIMPDSEEYELGERWMSLSIQGYGIHGTNDIDSIGKYSTAGCIRMLNDDIIELYDIVPRGTEVEIVDSAESESRQNPGDERVNRHR